MILLTLRTKKGQNGKTGVVSCCPLCLTPATQEHYLKVCPVNAIPRSISSSLSRKYTIDQLKQGNFFALYNEIRSMSVATSDNNNPENSYIPSEDLTNFARAIASMAILFCTNVFTLTKMRKVD